MLKELIQQVKELFEGHINLMSGFNTFLPEGSEIMLPEEDEPLQIWKKVEPLSAFSFVRKIKSDYDTRFELDKLLESINATIKSVKELSPSTNAATTMTELILHRRSFDRPPFSLYMAASPSVPVDLAEPVPPERREKPGVFLQRNKTKGTVGDEIEDARRSMEGLLTNNGLESKVDSDTMKVSYFAGSEDFMFRTRRRRKALYHKSLCSGASNGSQKLKRKLMFS